MKEWKKQKEYDGTNIGGSVDDALKDIDEKINSGEVIRYFELR